MTLDRWAELVATYAIPLLSLLILLIAGVIIVGWRFFSRNGPALHRRARALRQCIGRTPLIAPLRIRYPRAWHFLHKRVTPGEYLGLHLTVGLLLMVAALLVFGEFVEELWDDEEVTRFDRALVIALQQQMSQTALQVFAAITRIGDVRTIVWMGLAVAAFLLIRRQWLLLAGWAVTLIGGGVMNVLLKEIFQRARPEVLNPFITAPGWSFPSGHAMGSLMAYGMLAYVLMRLGRPEWRLPVVVATVALVVLIGASRVVLQVHYFSDVAAGFAAGVAWLAVCVVGTEVALRRGERR